MTKRVQIDLYKYILPEMGSVEIVACIQLNEKIMWEFRMFSKLG